MIGYINTTFEGAHASWKHEKQRCHLLLHYSNHCDLLFVFVTINRQAG